MPFDLVLVFPCGSASKESTFNAGDPGSIPGSGRSSGEGKRYPLQYSWASLVVQLVKNPPAMPETWVQSLGWEDPPEKGKATHSSILSWKIPWAEQSMGLQRVRHNWATFTFFLSIVNTAAINFSLHYFWYICIHFSLESVHQIRTADSKNTPLSNFIR